ncbi:Two pore calcium channel protein 1 [Acipenser ruthenus]|uniref:Two pore calcium channel protein 1 n=1 Tax=Acipenser ruthenus TaxID=7906 RepID=A0A444UN31_ACIRT|nr:Two pore calcium channel protein 1 [Acipenser ruthenus]
MEIQLAAAYVSDAQYNRNILFDRSPEGIRLYRLYNHWGLLSITYIFIVVDLALAIFEEPAVVPLPIWATSLVEFLCLLVFTGRLVHFAKVIPRKSFWKDAKNICIIVTILVRRAFRSIRNTLPQILYVFLLFIFSVLMFSLMALKLFGKRNYLTIEGKPYFTNYLEVVFNLYVLVTTANSPDVMMPAYNNNTWFSIFFILYIIINTYVFMSVFLAVIYNNYKKHLKEEVKQLVSVKRHKMVKAFKVLQVCEGNEYIVRQSHWNQLVKMVEPSISNAYRELLWSVSDDEQKGYIGKVAFVQLADLLNIRVITTKARIHPLQTWLPDLYHSAGSRLIHKMVQHKGFVYAYDLIILINAVFIGMDEENAIIAYAEWVFLGLYLVEISLKLYTYEPRLFFAKHQFWNWFDTIIIIAALVATIVTSVLRSSGGYNSQQVLDIVFILRVLRLIRIVDSIKRFRSIINTLMNIGPTMLTFGQLVVVVYYIFAIIGMEIFKYKIKSYSPDSTDPESEFCGNILLKDSKFANYKYYISEQYQAFVIIFLNSKILLASGFTMVTHISAILYFIIFHIVVVIIILNIFIAFILEAFFVEYTVEKSNVQTSIEKKIQELQLGIQEDQLEGTMCNDMETPDNDLGPTENTKVKPTLMFEIASKRYRTADALLQHIFQADLSPDDDGSPLDESDEDSLPADFNFQNPAFDSV